MPKSVIYTFIYRNTWKILLEPRFKLFLNICLYEQKDLSLSLNKIDTTLFSNNFVQEKKTFSSSRDSNYSVTAVGWLGHNTTCQFSVAYTVSQKLLEIVLKSGILFSHPNSSKWAKPDYIWLTHKRSARWGEEQAGKRMKNQQDFLPPAFSYVSL